MNSKQERNLFFVVLRLWLFMAAISMSLIIVFITATVIFKSPILGIGALLLTGWIAHNVREKISIPSTISKFFRGLADSLEPKKDTN